MTLVLVLVLVLVKYTYRQYIELSCGETFSPNAQQANIRRDWVRLRESDYPNLPDRPYNYQV